MQEEKKKFRKYKKEPVDKTPLNVKQKIAYEHIEKHYQEFHNDMNPFRSKQTQKDQLLFQIQGKAGTGKS